MRWKLISSIQWGLELDEGWVAFLVSLSLSLIYSCFLDKALLGFWLRDWKVSVSLSLSDWEIPFLSLEVWPLDGEISSVWGHLLTLVGPSTVKPQISHNFLEVSGSASQPPTQPTPQKLFCGDIALWTSTVSTHHTGPTRPAKALLCSLCFGSDCQLEPNKILRPSLELGNAPKTDHQTL